MVTDARTGPDPGLAERLSVPAALEIFEGFDSAELVEYSDSYLGDRFASSTQVLLLDDNQGPSYGFVNYEIFSSRLPVKSTRDFFPAGIGNALARSYDSPSLIGEISYNTEDLVYQLANDDNTGSFCRALGFRSMWHEAPAGEDRIAFRATSTVIPGPEKVNSILAEVFGRTPEDGYPQFRTFRRADGTSGKLTLDEFIDELADGYYPISDGDLVQGDPDFFVHDAVDHLPGYVLFTPEINQLVRQTAEDLQTTPSGSHNTIKVCLADAVDELSDFLRQTLINGYVKPDESSGSFSPDAIFGYLKTYGYVLKGIEGMLTARHDASQIIQIRTQGLLKYQKPDISEEQVTAMIRGLAENMSDMLNRAREYEQARAA